MGTTTSRNGHARTEAGAADVEAQPHKNRWCSCTGQSSCPKCPSLSCKGCCDEDGRCSKCTAAVGGVAACMGMACKKVHRHCGMCLHPLMVVLVVGVAFAIFYATRKRRSCVKLFFILYTNTMRFADAAGHARARTRAPATCTRTSELPAPPGHECRGRGPQKSALLGHTCLPLFAGALVHTNAAGRLALCRWRGERNRQRGDVGPRPGSPSTAASREPVCTHANARTTGDRKALSVFSGDTPMHQPVTPERTRHGAARANTKV